MAQFGQLHAANNLNNNNSSMTTTTTTAGANVSDAASATPAHHQVRAHQQHQQQHFNSGARRIVYFPITFPDGEKIQMAVVEMIHRPNYFFKNNAN